MKIKILGTTSPFCIGKHNGPGFLIETEENKIMLDCGSGATKILNIPDCLKNFNIFISHMHKDHYTDIYNLMYSSFVFNKLGILDKKIEAFISTKDKKIIKSFNQEINHFNFNSYNEKDIIKIDNIQISFCKVKHSEEDCYAIKIDDGKYKIVYTGDISFDSKNKIISFAKEADVLISDSSMLESHPQNNTHLTAKQAAIIAKEAKVKQLILTHFWPLESPYLYLEEAQTIFPNSTIALEGLEYDLKTNTINNSGYFNIGFYAGSFNPFTNGHLEIVKKASAIFDTIIIGMAINEEKINLFDPVKQKKMLKAIKESLLEVNIKNAEAIIYNGLTVDTAKKYNASYLVRGIRNGDDYSYEEKIAKFNIEKANLDTIYLRVPGYESISSTEVRKLLKRGEDISQLVPPAVEKILKKERSI